MDYDSIDNDCYFISLFILKLRNCLLTKRTEAVLIRAVGRVNCSEHYHALASNYTDK